MLRCTCICSRSVGAQPEVFLRRDMSTTVTRVGHMSGRLGKAVSSQYQRSPWIYSSIWRYQLQTISRGNVVRHASTFASPFWEDQSSPLKSENLTPSLRPKKSDWKSKTDGSPEEAAVLLDIASGKAASKINTKVLDLEMRWLKDPKELAFRVGTALRDGDAALAAAMVRGAQAAQMECSASWNRLMHYCMNRGAPLAAFKFYNDMKKRGRRPDEFTYTIMLDGLVAKPHQRDVNPVERAYSIYKSISAPNSGVKPNIIHHNAMLKVCETYLDMDTLWKVVGELPEEGPDAPDVRTYTIILSAIKGMTEHATDSINPDEADNILARRAVGLRDGKRIWADMLTQWREGRMVIDNHLVNTMETLLISGFDERGCYDALALYNQTMGIPLLVRKPFDTTGNPLSPQGLLETTVRGSFHVPRNQNDKNIEFVDNRQTAEPDPDRTEETEPVDNFENLFDPVANTLSNENDLDGKPGSKPTLLKPNNIDLTNILEACRLMTQGLGAGQQYWDLLILEGHKGHKIQPDAHSCHQYLRLLRVARSSRVALDVIRDQMVPMELVEPKTFHIAMSCCRRDRRNPNILNIANEMLALMNTHLPLPDPRPLLGYLDMVNVLAANPQWLLTLKGLAFAEADRSNLGSLGRKLRVALHSVALSKIRPLVSKLYDAVEQGQVNKSATRYSANTKDKESVNGFLALRALVRTRGLIDTILSPQYETLLPQSDREWLLPEEKKLRKFSKPEMVVKLSNSLLSPTWEQRRRFLAAKKSYIARNGT